MTDWADMTEVERLREVNKGLQREAKHSDNQLRALDAALTNSRVAHERLLRTVRLLLLAVIFLTIGDLALLIRVIWR